MSWQTWVIIGLLIFGYYWYNNPEGGHNTIDKGINITQTVIGNIKDRMNNGNTNECPTNYDPVCYHNVTYKNMCAANNAGAINSTLGVCQ